MSLSDAWSWVTDTASTAFSAWSELSDATSYASDYGVTSWVSDVSDWFGYEDSDVIDDGVTDLVGSLYDSVVETAVGDPSADLSVVLDDGVSTWFEELGLDSGEGFSLSDGDYSSFFSSLSELSGSGQLLVMVL